MRGMSCSYDLFIDSLLPSRIEEVRQQINDMHSGKEKGRSSFLLLLFSFFVPHSPHPPETVSVPKLIDCNTLSVRFVGVLQEVFKTFDKNNDGALSPDELDAFTRYYHYHYHYHYHYVQSNPIQSNPRHTTPHHAKPNNHIIKF